MTTIHVKFFEKSYSLHILKTTNKKVQAQHELYLYKGEFQNRKANGQGTLFCEGKKYLEGTWKDGFITKGKFYDNDKVKYDGDFKKGLFDGKGVLRFEDEFYSGEFKKGKKNGSGEIFDDDEPNKPMVKGIWKDDKLVYGKEFAYPDGNVYVLYEGHANGYKNGWIIKHGKGTKYQENGNYVIGTFKNNSLEGKAKTFREDGTLEEEGTYKHNFLEGIGIKYWQNGKNIYSKGKYVKGRMTGKGKEYYNNEENSLRFEGNFVNGKKKGKGTSFYPNGNVEYSGTYDSGKFKGTKYAANGHDWETGNFHWGMREGYFKIYRNSLLYDKGNWENNYREGLHSIYYPNGKLEFKGTFKHNDKTGEGKEYWENGKVKYDGMFRYDYYNGKGKKYNQDGKLVEFGTFYSGYLVEGTKCREDGEYIKGEWNYLGKNGKCTEYWENKKKKREGVWKDDKMNGEFTMYYYNGNLELKGTFKDDKRHGKGTDYNLDGSVKRTGYWKEGVYIGKESPQKHKQKQKKTILEENNIKKYMQTNDKDFLKKVSPSAMKEYLKKYAKKQVSVKTKVSLLKELQKWRKELKEPKIEEHNEPMVFDAYEGTDVPIREFLEEDNRVIFISDRGHAFGTYLEQCEIVYECQTGRSFYDYIGKDDVRAMIQFPSASGPKFYFDTDIDKDLEKGFNVFHFKTEPKDIKVLSKNVANGAFIVSALHCDPKDVIKHSVVTKKEKQGGGLKKTIKFEF